MQRRDVLRAGGAGTLFAVLAGAGLITPEQAHAASADRASFAATTMEDALTALGAGRPAVTQDIRIQAPDVAENGAVVPVTVSSTLPGTTSIALLVERNRTMLAASFILPEGTLPTLNTRIKMAESSNIYALVNAGGRFYMASREIQVTQGGCGG